MKMPVLFVSHGAPALPLEPGDTGALWRKLGKEMPNPSAILMISAHWESPIPTVSCALHPETIQDFSGFPAELYKLQYPAPGAPEMAQSVMLLLHQAGIPAQMDHTRGLDHGAWVPLSLMYPQANIPVAQLSLQPAKDPAWHIALGKALRPLREQGVLIIGSGSITHNLRAVFIDWMVDKIEAGDMDALSDYRVCAPHAAQNHPTDEHLLPLFVALGAMENSDSARHLNHVMTYGLLAMDAWLFEPA
jgi:4,5-DOPA dioxygenase extradiol